MILDSFSNPFTVIDLLFIVCKRPPTTIDMFLEGIVMVIEFPTNVVVDLSIDFVTDDLADGFIGVYADILLEVGVSDVRIIAVSAAVIALEFAVPVSCASDVWTGVVVDVLVDVLTSMSAGEIICVRPGIGVDPLAEVSVNVSPDVIILEIAGPAPPFPKLMLCC